MIVLKHISKKFGTEENEVQALADVSLSFRDNEFVAILGPSGCGKTTLLNVIAGIETFDGGRLIIDGDDTTGYNSRKWDSYRNSQIGVVFQEYNLIPHQSVLSNVELALKLNAKRRRITREKALNALSEVNISETESQRLPAQLSGGQKQRVAIARALVNDPAVLLADEPTGALDSATGTAVMNCLKRISETRLVIMVTHNRELAEKYATRIICLKDGKVTSDSNPYTEPETGAGKTPVHTRVSLPFLTSLRLSVGNLKGKKTRTVLTAISGSIGILCIALILALGNGARGIISSIEEKYVSTYPIVLSKNEESEHDHSSENNTMFPTDTNIRLYAYHEQVTESTGFLSDEYIQFIEKLDRNYYLGVTFTYAFNMNVYRQSANRSYARVDTENWGVLPSDNETILSQYELLCGKLPELYDEIVLVTDNCNGLYKTDYTNLGFTGRNDEMSFDDVLACTYQIFGNDVCYEKTEGCWIYNVPTDSRLQTADRITLKIVGILRANSEIGSGLIDGSIGYRSELIDEICKLADQSEIVRWQKANTKTDAFTGLEFSETEQYSEEQQFENNLVSLGAIKKAELIYVFPNNTETSSLIKQYLEKYNTDNPEDYVSIQDQMKEITESFSSSILMIEMVLLMTSLLCVLVSSMLVAIVTYISVLDRRKEIGILRCLGTSRKGIRQIFGAETIITGLIGGVLGTISAILTATLAEPLVSNLFSIKTELYLNPVQAVLVILFSIAVSYISGLIPSIFASGMKPALLTKSE